MDRLSLKREFRVALWLCHCGQEDTTDLNVGTPSVYEHNCSVCNKWSNSFKEYNGVLSYTPEEYAVIKEQDVDKSKQAKVDEWIYGIKNPPPYVEPTVEDCEKMIADKQAELSQLEIQKAEIIAKKPIKEVIK